MKNLIPLGMLLGLLTSNVHAAPGEFWEMSSTTEVAATPFPTPPKIEKICIANGVPDPQRLQSKDDNCKITDIKNVNKNVSWQTRCVEKLATMVGDGEIAYTRNSMIGKSTLSGQMGAEKVVMNIHYRGKRLGGNCDTDKD